MLMYITIRKATGCRRVYIYIYIYGTRQTTKHGILLQLLQHRYSLCRQMFLGKSKGGGRWLRSTLITRRHVALYTYIVYRRAGSEYCSALCK